MSEEEQNENLLDVNGISGISKSLGGNAKLLKIGLFIMIGVILVYMVKTKKLVIFK